MSMYENCYFSEIKKIPLLSLEEEKEIARKSFSGDKNAQKKLVEANLRFVLKIAKNYKDYNLDFEDLVAEGNLGLIHAAEKYNPDNNKNAKFITYAGWWIKAYIQKAIRETSTGVRFPATQWKELTKDEWKILSLDKKVKKNDESESELMDLIKDMSNLNPEEEFLFNEIQNKLYVLVDNLNESEQFVITKRYGFDGEAPMSLSQVGNLLGYSKERIRQIEKRAVQTMRTILEKEQYELSEMMAA